MGDLHVAFLVGLHDLSRDNLLEIGQFLVADLLIRADHLLLVILLS